MALLGLVFPLVTAFAGALITAYIDEGGTVTRIVYWFVLLVSPFNVLSQGLSNCLYDGFIAKARTEQERSFFEQAKQVQVDSGALHDFGIVVLINCGQILAYFTICVLWDWYNCNKFKGEDNN
jgi:hypothetical protein